MPRVRDVAPRLAGMMEMDVTGQYTTIETVTPEIAANWLRLNVGHNRKLQPGRVKILADMMARGEWKLSHQAVAFNRDGQLCDGQHRISAVVASGVAVKMSITRGVENDAYKVMDQGWSRSLSDATGADRRIANAASYAIRICKGSRRPSVAQFEALMNTEFGRNLVDLVGYCGTTVKVYSSSAVKVAAALVACDGDLDRAHAFAIYRALVLLDFDEMPPVARAFVRQTQSGKVRTSGDATFDIFARCLVVFDRRRQHISKIQMDDAGVKAALARLRGALEAQIAAHEADQ